MNELLALVGGLVIGFLTAALIARALIRLAYARGFNLGVVSAVNELRKHADPAMLAKIQELYVEAQRQRGQDKSLN